MPRDLEAAHSDAIPEDVARRTVPCVGCGAPILWVPAAGKWRHVRGDRLGPTRCRPGALDQACPPDDAGQLRLDTEARA